MNGKTLYHIKAKTFLLLSALLLSPLLLCQPRCPHAADMALLYEDLPRLSLAPYMKYLEDPAHEWTLEKLRAGEPEFLPFTDDQSNFGFSDATFWLRLRLGVTQREAEKEWFLEVGYPLIDRISLYYRLPDGNIREIQAGDSLPFGRRALRYRNTVFPIRTRIGQVQTLYMKIRTESSLQLPLTLWSPAAFAEKVNKEQFGMGLYYGVMLVMMLYNFCIFLSVRDRNHLFYILYILGYGLFQLSLSGQAYQFLWPDFPWWAGRSAPFLMGFAGFWGTCFSRSFLRAGHYAPRWNCLLLLMMAGAVLVMILALGISYGRIIRIATLFVIFNALCILCTALACQLRGYRTARFFTAAWGIFLSAVLICSLKTFGIFPSGFFSNHAIYFSSVMEVILLSLALNDRISRGDRENGNLPGRLSY